MTDTVNWESVLADDQQRLAIAWFNFRDADEKRLAARRHRLQLIAANPEWQAAEDEVKRLESITNHLLTNVEEAKVQLQQSTGEAYAAGHSKKKTMLDGFVTATESKQAVVHWDESIAQLWGAKTVREHPELVGQMFKIDKAGLKKLATANKDAAAELGLLEVPEQVMVLETSYGGRVNKGWENTALELLPLDWEGVSDMRGSKVTYTDLTGYPAVFVNHMRKLVLQRDQYACQADDCFEYGAGMHVHHIDGNKRNNTPQNLITLCPADHAKFGSDPDANLSSARLHGQTAGRCPRSGARR